MTIAPPTSTEVPTHDTPRIPDGDRPDPRRTVCAHRRAAPGRPALHGRRPTHEILDEVIMINRGVAESVASRYRDRGIVLDDLHQVAYLGLTRAVRRFDSDRAEDLLTYAVPTIRGELQRY